MTKKILAVRNKLDNNRVQNIVLNKIYHTPDANYEILKYGYISDIKTIYRPVYIMHGDFEASYHLAFGTDREESYTKYRKVYHGDSGYSIEPSTITKTVTDWQLSGGQSNRQFCITFYAGREFPETDYITYKIKMDDIVELNATDFSIEDVFMDFDDAYSNFGEIKLNTVIEKSITSGVKGKYKINGLSKGIDYDYFLAYIPIVHVSVRYGEKIIQFALNGANFKNPEMYNRGSIRFYPRTQNLKEFTLSPRNFSVNFSVFFIIFLLILSENYLAALVPLISYKFLIGKMQKIRINKILVENRNKLHYYYEFRSSKGFLGKKSLNH